jgi:secondary thiamine-phosphate synthase enzyme
VSAMHITAGIFVNDNEPGPPHDIMQWLEELAPAKPGYQHHHTGEDNADAHLKSLLVHHGVIVPITAGQLDLGTWQRIFYAEFDGQRSKRIFLKAMGGSTMQTSAANFAQLHTARYISLTTFRKTGEPVATPVWFAEQDGTIYIFTFPGAGKVKRIRHTPRVTLAPCTVGGKVTGPTSEGRARILTEPAEEAWAERILAKKYGMTWRGYHALMGLGRAIRGKPKSQRVFLAIEPAG